MGQTGAGGYGVFRSILLLLLPPSFFFYSTMTSTTLSSLTFVCLEPSKERWKEKRPPIHTASLLHPSSLGKFFFFPPLSHKPTRKAIESHQDGQQGKESFPGISESGHVMPCAAIKQEEEERGALCVLLVAFSEGGRLSCLFDCGGHMDTWRPRT